MAKVRQEQSLADWAQELPYPLATALWSAQSEKTNPHAENRQLFLFWEATAAFTGTVLLSALAQDDFLREDQLRGISAVLVKQRLTMNKAGFGVWMVVAQRLGRLFRGMLNSQDRDERARLDGLFAGAPEDLVRALCSTDLANLLSEVTKRRNELAAHGGALSVQVRRELNAWLTKEIQALQALFDGAWTDAPLVRAGKMSLRDGVFIHDVELVMGTNTPFLTYFVRLGTPMVEGGLYLVTDGAQRGMPLQPLVQLRSSPASAQYACYFYNRLEGGGARLVSYHLGGGDDHVVEPFPELTALVAAFDPPEDSA